MQAHTKTGMVETMENSSILPRIVDQTSVDSEKKNVDAQIKSILVQEMSELELDTRQRIINKYYLKYQYDHVFVIGDNRLKQNVEVMVGKRTLYCAFHDTRNSEYDCEQIRFIKELDEIQT